jgi:hypothetical protein
MSTVHGGDDGQAHGRGFDQGPSETILEMRSLLNKLL